MSNLAIIPARGGSKRIPRKNIKSFLGKPIIAYAIETAIESGMFDEVMVSTDDEEIAEISRKYGASVPFMRSEQSSNDYATTAEVILEVLENYNEIFAYACCIYPTAPFITKKILYKAFESLKDNQFDSVFPVVRFSYPIQRSLYADNDKIKMVWPEYLNCRSQDLDIRYHDAGQFYWFNVMTYQQKKRMFTDNSGFVEVSELEIQDIDNETDWAIAEMKYKLTNQ